jgi:hypothetical protein
MRSAGRHEIPNVLERTRGEIVENRHFIAARQKTFGEMRSDEARAACDECSHFEMFSLIRISG